MWGSRRVQSKRRSAILALFLIGCAHIDNRGCPNASHPGVDPIDAPLEECGLINYVCSDDGVPYYELSAIGQHCGCGCVSPAIADDFRENWRPDQAPERTLPSDR